jgi:hypothetical protein
MSCEREMSLEEVVKELPEYHRAGKEYRFLKEGIIKLRGALANFIGASQPKDLDELELAFRSMPGPEADKITAIDAIHVLRETWPLEGVPDAEQK